MEQNDSRRALVVRGGWDGHSPIEATDRFIPFLKEHGFDVAVFEGPEVYTEQDRLVETDLVVHCFTFGVGTDEQIMGLSNAVRAGTGLAGWHGGLLDAFRASSDYLHLTGGQFAAHPGSIQPHTIEVVPEKADHPIMAGLPSQWHLNTEQYWCLVDALNDVLATSTFEPGPDTPWHERLVTPAVWTRRWGAGRIFASTVGHKLEDLDDPTIRTMTERGLLWASR
jgi:type 1 glutamine amidotransferase